MLWLLVVGSNVFALLVISLPILLVLVRLIGLLLLVSLDDDDDDIDDDDGDDDGDVYMIIDRHISQR